MLFYADFKSEIRFLRLPLVFELQKENVLDGP